MILCSTTEYPLSLTIRGELTLVLGIGLPYIPLPAQLGIFLVCQISDFPAQSLTLNSLTGDPLSLTVRDELTLGLGIGHTYIP